MAPPRLGKNARGKTAPPIKTAAAADDPASQDPQYVASKDTPLLAQVFQQYEEKKYAASVQSADLLLKKYPKNAQTMCMKGLSTYNTGKREEGKDLARQGLALDLKSHVCWHVNALIYRADREYVEALKCYSQGHRIEPNDLNILRDLTNLQLYLRKYDAAANSRLQLLRVQPRIRYNWTALAVANHLAGNLPLAIEYLDTYCDMLESTPPLDYEYSEVVLYRIQVYIEAGQLGKAMALLEKEGKRIVDLQTKKEVTAQLQKGLGKMKTAELSYAALLEDNPDHKGYVKEYLSCKGIDIAAIDESNRTEALAALAELTDRLPRSRTIRRTVLDVSSGETFRKRVRTYLIDGLTKGIPSLFSDVKRLLDDPEKRSIVLETAKSFRDAMESGKTIDGDDSEDAEEAPTTYIWLLYFLAQTHLHIHEYTEALSLIGLAISHTPSLPELHMIRARIYKRSGDLLAAEEAMAQARALDLQDRYLNGKHVKYLMNMDEIEKGEETAGLFTRKDAESPRADLIDMQCMWFLVAEAESYKRQGKFGLALKRYHQIEKTFAEIFEDEFEFHAYCMRKFTMRACVNMARANDVLRKHPAFLKAARGAAEIYLQLDKHPYEAPATNGTHVNGTSDATLDLDAPVGKKDEDGVVTEVDQDPNGNKLYATTTPLKDLTVFMGPVEALGGENVEAQALIFDVALRKKEYLKALKALLRTQELAPDSPDLHSQLGRFASVVQSADPALPESMKGIVTQELEPLVSLSQTTLEKFNADYLQRHAGDAEAVLAAAQVQWAVSAGQDSQGVSSMLLQAARKENKASLKTVQAALSFLKNEVRCDTRAFQEAARDLYSNATILKSEEEIKDQKESIAEQRRKEREAGNEDN